jgi:hypothetical protein
MTALRAPLRGRSAWRLNKKLQHLLRRQPFESGNHQVGAGLEQFIRGMMAHETDGDTFHAAGLGRLDACHRIFEDHTTRRRPPQPFRRQLEHLRIGFASGRVFGRNNGLEKRRSLRQTKDEVDIAARRAGSDRLGYARCMERTKYIPSQ